MVAGGEQGLRGNPGLTPLPCPCYVPSISAEFQRGQYPDSVARGKLAAATSLPEDTVRVSERCHTKYTNHKDGESVLERVWVL